MKVYLQVLVICLIGWSIQGQVNDSLAQKFVLDLMEHQTLRHCELRIISPIDSGFFIDGIKILDSLKEYKFVVDNRNYHDSIIISEEEKLQVLTSLKEPHTWSKDMRIAEKYRPLTNDSLMQYLAYDVENTIALISKPVFLRDSTVAVCYFVNLCCGHIYGYLNFSFYKIENGIWTRWIDIRSGAF